MGKLLNMYSYLLANWLDGGAQVRRGKMQATDVVPQYNAIFTKSAAKKVYRMTGIKPVNVDLCFIDYIRERMFDLNPDVEVIISVHNYPVKVDVTSDKFNRAMVKASEAYNSYREIFEKQSGLARLTGRTFRMPGGGRIRLSKERLDDLYQVYISYVYLYNHLSNGGTTNLTSIFFEIVGEDMRRVKRAGEDLIGLLGPLNVGCEEVRSVLKTYLTEFGPAMPMFTKLNKKFLPQMLFTEENITAFTSYKSRGLVGGKGILLGMDFRSRLPLSINIFAAPSAQVFMLLGKSGSGKTFAAFQMALSALALGEYVTAIDIKGREWSRISGFVGTKILTFDERHPSFVNTLRLNDVRATKENANELYNTAVKGTVSLLSLIVNLNPSEGNTNDLELVLREAVTKLYTMSEVDPNNPASFENTANLQYSDLLPIMESLSSTVTYTPAQKSMLVLARSRCHAYIGSSGIFADAFKNEVTLGDVMNTPLVIYELNKNQNAMSDSLDVLRVFMIQFLDSKKKAMLREQGKFLFCFYEELQRCESFGDLLNFICAEVTGSRSNNAVIVLLLNSLKVLQGEKAQDIRSNITSLLVGSCEDNDIRTIGDQFGRPWLASQLSVFKTRPNIYRNCFAADVDTGAEILQTVYKVQIPEELRAQFQTRTTKD